MTRETGCLRVSASTAVVDARRMHPAHRMKFLSLRRTRCAAVRPPLRLPDSMFHTLFRCTVQWFVYGGSGSANRVRLPFGIAVAVLTRFDRESRVRPHATGRSEMAKRRAKRRAKRAVRKTVRRARVKKAVRRRRVKRAVRRVGRRRRRAVRKVVRRVRVAKRRVRRRVRRAVAKKMMEGPEGMGM